MMIVKYFTMKALVLWFATTTTTTLCLFSSNAQAQTYLNANAAVEDRVSDLLSRLTLQEKVSQMIMDIENAWEKAPGVGSYMIGASDPPLVGNTPAGWRTRRNELQATNEVGQRFKIPLLMAADAVHGHNILQGATIFPHNIGLGCARNVTLMREIAVVTASEVLATAVDLTFAPTLAVARDIRWGRTYESYAENTELVQSYATDFIQGLQGGMTLAPNNLVATAKHWVGDGGTTNGDDAGDTALSEQDLLSIHGKPYDDAIAADVGAVMVSFSSVNGVQMHQHQHLITNVLKETKNFQGIVMSDWLGHQRITGDIFVQIREAVNAGIDLLMVPYLAYSVINAITVGVNDGSISQARIDDAVRRILRIKFKAGLFETMVDPIDPNDFSPIRTTEHQDTARQAVRESLVLLRNENNALPLNKHTTRIFLAGKSADNMQNQCGGWTMSWQGTSNEDRHRIVGGKTIKQGLEMHTSIPITHSLTGTGGNAASSDVAIVVVGERPYAEGAGDDLDLQIDGEDIAAIANAKNAGIPVILVLISGRPMILNAEVLNGVDAIVAAWLPGTEGDGIAEVLFGDYGFSGKLSFSWPRNIDQLQSGFIGDNTNVLFEYGFGLTYSNQVASPTQAPTSSPTGDPSSTLRPTSSPTNSPTKAPTTTKSPACSVHPACAALGLSGDCCTTISGVRLACCEPALPPPPQPTPSPPTPTPPAPDTGSSSCQAHPRCAALAGTCCPVESSGVALACCGQPALPPPEYPAQTGLCSAHFRCAQRNLSGQCCPAVGGVMLDCCDEEHTLSVYQAIVAGEPSDGSGSNMLNNSSFWGAWSILALTIVSMLLF